jgi:hypothetical protein
VEISILFCRSLGFAVLPVTRAHTDDDLLDPGRGHRFTRYEASLSVRRLDAMVLTGYLPSIYFASQSKSIAAS